MLRPTKPWRNVLLVISAVLCFLLIQVSQAAAQDDESLLPPEDKLAVFLELAEAYQVGYMQVVACCCYQLYVSTGIIATDFANGYIDGETALAAIDENSLLHSVCHATLIDIQSLTPADDVIAQRELGRLLTVLTSEQQLLEAIRAVMETPTDENAAAVESARKRVEQVIDEYVMANDDTEEDVE
jgi:hypothetical protein